MMDNCQAEKGLSYEWKVEANSDMSSYQSLETQAGALGQARDKLGRDWLEQMLNPQRPTAYSGWARLVIRVKAFFSRLFGGDGHWDD